jgi:hypothetical protein
LLVLASDGNFACLQASNESRFVHLDSDVYCAAPLLGLSLGQFRYIISLHVGMDLAHWAQRVAPYLTWPEFFSQIQVFCVDLVTGGGEMAEKVSFGCCIQYKHMTGVLFLHSTYMSIPI